MKIKSRYFNQIDFIFKYSKSNLKSQKEDKESKSKSKDNKKPLKFPWWCKIIAYILSFIFAFLSLFFIVIKGISFGDEKVNKWITSILVSFVSSVLLIQPLQVF
jgi:hypothetical protein